MKEEVVVRFQSFFSFLYTPLLKEIKINCLKNNILVIKPVKITQQLKLK